MTTKFTLTPEQDAAKTAFFAFTVDPKQTVLVITGYSGTGKSTLVKTLLDEWDSFQKTIKLIAPNNPALNLVLSATTNKAAENLASITGKEAKTIHSLLGLRVVTDYSTQTTKLVKRKGVDAVTDSIIFIDEASYIDSALLNLIFELPVRCKVVFIGDPAQLIPIKATAAPVFKANFNTAALTQVVRQAEGNPIIELATQFRNTVNTGNFFKFVPDGTVIRHLTREDFNQEISNEFSRKDWQFKDSKVLAWTNKTVISYNNMINDLVKGTPDLQIGDYAVCNNYIASGNHTIKTDQLVNITDIYKDSYRQNVLGNIVVLDNYISAFLPKSKLIRDAAVKKAKAENNYQDLRDIDNWIDLRAAYAQTVNKAQGSTYDRVFIDLDDIGKCNSGNQIARMLYVAVSRARTQVTLTGDLA